MVRRWVALTAILWGSWFPAYCASAADGVLNLTLEPCHLDGITAWVECGALTVPVDHDDTQSGTLTIGFARLPALSHTPDPIPLFVLAGGPGQAATDLARQVNTELKLVRRDRDIILVDQRGTGRSSKLSCDLEPEDPLASDYPLFDPQLLAACVNQLPAEIGQFHTFNAVRDFDAVRDALGYQQVHLYGGSYGTRAGIAWLALAPETVASAVLDAVAPPEQIVGLFGASAAAAFRATVDRCAADSDCLDAFPDTLGQWQAVMARLERGPVDIELPHPTTGRLQRVVFHQSTVVGFVRMLLYAPETAAMVPLVIDSLAREDYRPVIGLLAAVARQDAINPVVNLTIVCNEDFPRFTPEQLAIDADNQFGRDVSHRLWLEACPQWPRYELPGTERYAFRLDVPTLLLSGARDPVTPPSGGELAARRLPNSRHVVAKEGAHTIGLSECGAKTMNQLFNGRAPQDLDVACFDALPEAPFLLNAQGLLSSADKTAYRAAASATVNTP